MAKRMKAPPYWLVAHEVICAVCDVPHAHAVEIRCVECDRSLCPTCAVEHLLEHFCPECLPRRKA
ncbi:MAG: hypothetical protein ACXVJO_10830 [Thermoanaerobaculia bacterium]